MKKILLITIIGVSIMLSSCGAHYDDSKKYIINSGSYMLYCASLNADTRIGYDCVYIAGRAVKEFHLGANDSWEVWEGR